MITLETEFWWQRGAGADAMLPKAERLFIETLFDYDDNKVKSQASRSGGIRQSSGVFHRRVWRCLVFAIVANN